MTAPPGVSSQAGLATLRPQALCSSLAQHDTPSLPTLASCEVQVREACEAAGILAGRGEVRRAAKAWREEWRRFDNPPIDLRILGIIPDPTASMALRRIA